RTRDRPPPRPVGRTTRSFRPTRSLSVPVQSHPTPSRVLTGTSGQRGGRPSSGRPDPRIRPFAGTYSSHAPPWRYWQRWRPAASRTARGWRKLVHGVLGGSGG